MHKCALRDGSEVAIGVPVMSTVDARINRVLGPIKMHDINLLAFFNRILSECLVTVNMKFKE